MDNVFKGDPDAKFKTEENITTIYNIFKDIRARDGRNIMDELFGKENKQATSELFFLYMRYNKADEINSGFWKPLQIRAGKTIASEVQKYDEIRQILQPTSVAEIDWRNSSSIMNFNNRIRELLVAQDKVTSGGGKQIKASPKDIVPILAEQKAWEEANSAYQQVEPIYQQLLPTPEPAPIHDLVEPFHRYIDENAHEHHIQEARDALGLLSHDELEALMNKRGENMDRILPLYKKALPNLKDDWIPIMIRADVLKTLV